MDEELRTEMSECLRVCKNQQTAALAAVTKKRNELSRLMTSESMLHLVKTGYDEYNVLCANYEVAHDAYCDELGKSDENEDTLHQQSQRFSDNQMSILEYNRQVMSWIVEAESILADSISRHSTKNSHSSRSTRQSTGSTATVRSREKARVAELLAEKAMLSRKLHVQAQEAELKLDTEIAKAEARVKSYCDSNPEIKTETDTIERLNIHVPICMIDNVPVVSNPNYANVSGVEIACTTDQMNVCIGGNVPNACNPIYVNTGVNVNENVAQTHNVTLYQTGTTEDVSRVSPVDVTSESHQATITPIVNPPITSDSNRMPRPIYVSSAMTRPIMASQMVPPAPLCRLNPEADVFQPFVNNVDRALCMGNPATQNHGQNHPAVVQPNHMKQLIDSQNQLAAAMSLPQPEVPKFRGEPTEYNAFIMAFDARIVSRVTNSSDKLYYLDQYLLGEPKELIGGCLFMHPDEGYQQARHILAKEYGDPFKVATAYVNKVISWPTVKFDDSTGLRSFAVFLMKCKNAMMGLSHMTVLNHAPNMQNAVQKLPSYLQNKWRDHVLKLRLNNARAANFRDLVHFVQFAAEAANDPIYSKHAIYKPASDVKLTNMAKSSNHRSSTFATNMEQNVTSYTAVASKQETAKNDGNDRAYKQPCQFCNGYHDIDVCYKFNNQSIDKRRLFLKNNHMCFGCYGTNHIAKGCTKKRTCKKCGKKHPSALHVDNFVPIHPTAYNEERKPAAAPDSREAESTTCLATGITDSVVLHSILPVTIRQKGNQQSIQTYAFYDNGSTGCFITEEVKEELGAMGKDVTLQLQTMHGQNYVACSAVENLVVSDFTDEKPIELPKTYTRDVMPVSHRQIPKPEMLQRWQHLQQIVTYIKPHMPHMKIGLLIGSNCPAALEPLEVVPTSGNGPFAMRLRHGWTVNGPVYVKLNSEQEDSVECHRIAIQELEPLKETINPAAVLKLFEMDFNEHKNGELPDERGYSQEDIKFMSKVNDGLKYVNNKYEVPLPFRKNDVTMPNNKSQALTRAKWQKKKMLKSESYHKDYVTFVQNVIDKGYAEKVPEAELDGSPGKLWYLSHHGVYHPKKPNKIRVVFDASAKYEGLSLNDCLLQGPNLTNSLVGVLCRFREGPVAFMGDIESMFYQVKVPTIQRDFLRFLWWPNEDLSGDPQEYRMTVHLFGAISSPSVANFVLKHVANEAEAVYGPTVADVIKRNFYVDDCLRSLFNEQQTINQIKDVTSACASGGFRLTKFASNNSEVLKSIPLEDRAKEVQTCDLDCDDLPIERALGVNWCAQTDSFGFSSTLKIKQMTRRGILSTVSSIYDPLGFISPFLLTAKKLLQDVCRDQQLGWDDEVPETYQTRWIKWLEDVPSINHVSIERCLQPTGFLHAVSKKIHAFSDASSEAYGMVAYLRLEDEQGNVHCSFLMGKSRLAPIKPMTIPRMELVAATVAVRVGRILLHELALDPQDIVYHTDSTTVLHYIKSETRRFPIFVANRIQQIHEFSNPSQWRYVNTSDNPADDASRGLSGDQILTNKRWFDGPEFLHKPSSEWPEQPKLCYENNDSEDSVPAASVSVHATDIDQSADTMERLLKHFSEWHDLKRAVVVFHRVQKLLQLRILQKMDPASVCSAQCSNMMQGHFTVQELASAEVSILKYVQKLHFKREIEDLTHNVYAKVSKRSSICRLDPFLDDGLLRVGGRLRRANLPEHTKHPILIHHKSPVTHMIIRGIHGQLGHAGRNHVLSKLREKYWITKANATVRRVLRQCVVCRRLRGPVGEQKMADLPADRMIEAPPFTYTGVDYFGPYTIKEGRKQMKRYGVLFTCLVSRAVHIETATSLDTDSFIQVLRRFIARRGPVQEMRSDNGTNFVGAERELFHALDQRRIEDQMLKQNIIWRFNPPAASHHGGVWERLIRSVRKVLSPMLTEYGDRLDDESLRTLLCEVEAIINSRPLTTVSDDPNDMDALTPNHLLTMKTCVITPPPGEFQRNDVYLKKRWRRVQYLCNLFWSRWKREYLLTLQARQKWNQSKRNLNVGDVVLVVDETSPRNKWVMGRIIMVDSDEKGFVRSATLKTPNSELRRPVTKLVLLLPIEEQL